MLLAAALQMLGKAGLSLLPTAVSCEQGEYFQPKHGKHCQDVGLALGDFPVTIFFHAVSSHATAPALSLCGLQAC